MPSIQVAGRQRGAIKGLGNADLMNVESNLTLAR